MTSPEKSASILIVEDDVDIADMLSSYFRVQGYDVSAVNWGEDGVRFCMNTPPDLVILDIRLPDIDGFEVAGRLRAHRRTRFLPIIFLTEKRERKDRLQGLELSADDYITKPFDVAELRLRVRNTLDRALRVSHRHPITGLPFGKLVDEQLGQALFNHGETLLVACLKNLEKFREIYGFVAADDFLRAESILIQDALDECGTQQDFLGQIGSSSFVIITTNEHKNGLKELLQQKLTQSFDYFYRKQDRQAGVFDTAPLQVQIDEYSFAARTFTDLQELKLTLEKNYP